MEHFEFGILVEVITYMVYCATVEAAAAWRSVVEDNIIAFQISSVHHFQSKIRTLVLTQSCAIDKIKKSLFLESAFDIQIQ